MQVFPLITSVLTNTLNQRDLPAEKCGPITKAEFGTQAFPY